MLRNSISALSPQFGGALAIEFDARIRNTQSVPISHLKPALDSKPTKHLNYFATNNTNASMQERQEATGAGELTPQQAYELLSTKGKDYLIDLTSDESAAKPNWLDQVRFADARKVMDKFFVG